MRYKIIVRALQGTILTFNVDDYSVEEGFITFTDLRTGLKKRFAVSNCEVMESV